jgi:colanic acid biosynthesis protein WcaH
MKAPPRLPDDVFINIVRHAPLISIDLIVEAPDTRVFLGLRENEPAKGTYFVPGGVIRKGETIEAAFARILDAELGLKSSIAEARFLGVFEHFYESNRFGAAGWGTHYVVLAYAVACKTNPEVVLDSQHSAYRWSLPQEIRDAPDVHANTKAYFRDATAG